MRINGDNEKMNPLAEHDRLYRVAYKYFLDNRLEEARRLALLASEKAHQVDLFMLFNISNEMSNCRADCLLKEIDRMENMQP